MTQRAHPEIDARMNDLRLRSAARREEREADLSSLLGDRHFASGWEAAARADVTPAARPPLPTLAIDFPAAINLASLDGSNGLRLDGIGPDDKSGWSVSSAGDVNGDGFDDVIIGALLADETYVVFGKAGGFAASLDLASLDGSNGFRLDGIDANDRSGSSVSSAGDINGDGFGDIVIGAYFAATGGEIGAGESYVVLGKAGGFSASLDLASLDGSNGFRLDGIDAVDLSGESVSSAGDVNGDGFDDIIVGARGGDPDGVDYAGESYLVFGKAGGFAASLGLASLDGSNGFRLDGIDVGDRSGQSVSSAGDVNGDGFDDIVIGTRSGDPGGDSYAGESYVVFGKAGGFAASLDLAGLDGSNGFRIDGIDAFDQSGGKASSVSSAGDVNGDGFDDIIIGAFGADPGVNREGESYVVFGKAGGFGASLDLASLNGSNGFRLDGIDAEDFSGLSVSSAGDVNGDGFDDIVIGAAYADPGGESYVVFGQAGGFAASLDLASLNGSNGFRLDGHHAGDNSGFSVSSAGDVNGDGFDDIAVGAPGAGFTYGAPPGASYVVFGRAPDSDVHRTGSAIAQMISGGIGDDTLEGLGGGDTLRAQGGDDELNGGSGADMLDGGDDYDRLRGGSGDDSLEGGQGVDTLEGGSGLDWATYATAATGLRANLTTPAANTGDAAGDIYSSIENLRGTRFADTLTGNAAGNMLAGGAGADSLVGGGGSDWADYATGGRVTADLQIPTNNTGEAAGDIYSSIENLRGGALADQLRGDANANRIEGGARNDVLVGRGGNDTLVGGQGFDQLAGQAGIDSFLLASANPVDYDRIVDLALNETILLDAAAFGLAPGALDPDAFVLGGSAQDVEDRFIYLQSVGKLFFDPDGAGGASRELIAIIENRPTLDASDFMVI